MDIIYKAMVPIIVILCIAAGILLYKYLKNKKTYTKPVGIPILNDREKIKKLNELIAPFGFAYDVKQEIFYSRTDGWQRKFGYGRIYDEAAAPLNMIIDCEPVYFDYDNKKWLIEFWKGQYGITTGAEVGVYYLTREEAMADHLFQDLIYKCVEDEDTLRIKTVLWKKGTQLFSRRGYHWWLTGFAMGEFSKPKELEMDIEITLKDEDMRDAFLQGLYRNGYRNGELNTQGNTVWIHFAKPHSRQPVTRTHFFCMVKQWENKRNCKLYRNVTGNYTNAYDKILALKVRAPKLSHWIESMGKSGIFPKGEQDEQI